MIELDYGEKPAAPYESERQSHSVTGEISITKYFQIKKHTESFFYIKFCTPHNALHRNLFV